MNRLITCRYKVAYFFFAYLRFIVDSVNFPPASLVFRLEFGYNKLMLILYMLLRQQIHKDSFRQSSFIHSDKVFKYSFIHSTKSF